MNFTAGQIADQINGTIVGDRDVDIFNISKIEEGTKGSLTFLANPKYTEFIYSQMPLLLLLQKTLNLLNKLTQP